MIKKVLGLFLIILIIFNYLSGEVHKKNTSIIFNEKAENYLKVYDIAFSTIVFNKYSYSKYANRILSYFYMFPIEDVLEQNFQLSEEYCLMAKKKCNIEWLYKEAVSYYCKLNIIESPRWVYTSTNKVNFKEKCDFITRRWDEIKRNTTKEYNLPILYWIPRL